MKSLKYLGLICLTFSAVGFTACNDDDDYFEDDAQNSEIVISKIYLEDAESSVTDREVDYARLGQIIRVEGSGLYGMKYVYVNGYDTYFNRTYVTDNSMMFQLDSDTPISDAEEDVRNTIRFVKDGAETTYSFTIRAASPSVSSISCTLPQPGETVTVYGFNLHETTLVTLPDGTEITDITSDEDGEWYSFVMPSGITQGGAIVSEGANGTASTPEYFNYSSCMVLDFDGNGTQGYWSWSETGSMVNADDLVDDPLSTGRGLCYQILPERLITAGGVVSNKSRAVECWTAGNDNDADDWSWMFSYIPAETSVEDIAFQFDVYVPESSPWTTCGQIEIAIINNYNFGGIGSDDDNDGNAVAFYVPYIEDGVMIDFFTEGWQTVTIPFSEFNKYAAEIEDGSSPTFQEIVDDRNSASYKNFGIAFANTDFTYGGVDVVAETFTNRIYLDNWRVVPCASITISDYPEDE